MSMAPIKIALEKALPLAGFKKSGKVWLNGSADVQVFVGFQKIEPGQQVAVNVGFWLTQMGAEAPAKIELTHLYYRLERLCPNLREIILAGGDFIDGDEIAKNIFYAGIALACIDRLKSLASVSALRAAFHRGELSEGLIRKEARVFLSSRED